MTRSGRTWRRRADTRRLVVSLYTRVRSSNPRQVSPAPSNLAEAAASRRRVREIWARVRVAEPRSPAVIEAMWTSHPARFKSTSVPAHVISTSSGWAITARTRGFISLRSSREDYHGAPRPRQKRPGSTPAWTDSGYPREPGAPFAERNHELPGHGQGLLPKRRPHPREGPVLHHEPGLEPSRAEGSPAHARDELRMRDDGSPARPDRSAERRLRRGGGRPRAAPVRVLLPATWSGGGNRAGGRDARSRPGQPGRGGAPEPVVPRRVRQHPRGRRAPVARRRRQHRGGGPELLVQHLRSPGAAPGPGRDAPRPAAARAPGPERPRSPSRASRASDPRRAPARHVLVGRPHLRAV